MKSLIHLYDDWKPVKEVFAKPKLYWYFGKWRHDPCLPVWRSGPVISFGRHGQYRYPYESYGNWAKCTYWEPNFLAKQSKFGRWWRSFIKPTYQLPIWLMFRFSNHSMYWKTKWDEYRYEFPPQLSIVFFGLSLSFWLMAPMKDKEYSINDVYWESILYYSNNKSLKEAIEKCGIWGYNEKQYFGIRPEFLTTKYQEEYKTITDKIRNEANKTII